MTDRDDRHVRNASEEQGPLIDRLVAGDLDEGRRRELLAWLDEDTGRWRQCGLAFLEAQLWEESFGRVVGERREAGDGRTEEQGLRREATVRRQEAPRSALGWSVVAAALLVAFGLGSFAGSAWNSSILGARGSAVTRDTDSASDPRGPATANSASQDHDVAAATERRSASPIQSFAVLKLPAAKDGDIAREVHLPVLEGMAGNRRWLRSAPEPLPESVLSQLERGGYQLQQRRRFLPVQLEDGRQALIPVDRYQIQFVGQQSL